MSEIPINARESMLGPKVDLLVVHMPVGRSVVKWLQMSTSEARITFELDKESTVNSPISGRVSHISQDSAALGYVLELQSDTADCILVGCDVLFVNQGEQVTAGGRLGAVKTIHEGQHKELYLTIVSKFAGVNLNAILRMRP